MDGRNRGDIKPGIEVSIVLKKDQRSGNLTYGKVKDILTNSKFHPHGIKGKTYRRPGGKGQRDNKKRLSIPTYTQPFLFKYKYQCTSLSALCLIYVPIAYSKTF